MAQLTGSVGRGGMNNRLDVITIQTLLNGSVYPPNPRLVVDGLSGPKTISAIEDYQRYVVKGVVDGRVDRNGATFQSLNGDGICRVERPDYSALVAAVDTIQETAGAGIVLIHSTGTKIEVRGGPRRLWVWIAPKGMIVEQAAPSPAGDPPAPEGLWDRWGGSVLSCGSAIATGVVIGMSGGTATPVVGAFAVNSALLCGTSLGKAIANDAWKEFAKSGGSAYRAWLTTETLLGFIDLFNGVKGTVSWFKSIGQSGKLAKLQAAVQGKKLTKNQIIAIIQQIDPAEAAKIGRKATRYRTVAIGTNILKEAGFVSPTKETIKRIADIFGNALSLKGSPDNLKAGKETVDVWLLHYDQEARPN